MGFFDSPGTRATRPARRSGETRQEFKAREANEYRVRARNRAWYAEQLRLQEQAKADQEPARRPRREGVVFMGIRDMFNALRDLEDDSSNGIRARVRNLLEEGDPNKGKNEEGKK